MNNKKNLQKFAGIVAGGAMLLSFATATFAESTSLNGTPDGNKTGMVKRDGKNLNLDKAKSRENEAIDKRVADLNNLISRVGEMKNVSDGTKATLTSSINTEIGKLNTLKTKIDADTDSASIKTDGKEITGGNRVYALFEPQARVLLATDKVNTVAGMISALVPKLQTRITNLQTAGKDVTALNTALTDLQAKVADATSKATSATTGVAGLVPDNGDKTVLASNNAALKSARSNIQMANKDLNDAQKDVKIITRGVRGTEKMDKKERSGDDKGTANPDTTSKTQ